MRNFEILTILLVLGAATYSAADDAVSITASEVVTTDDDIAEFLAVVTDALADSNPLDDGNDGVDAPSTTAASLPTSADERLNKHLGLGFADGLGDDSAGEHNAGNCRGNGHAGGYITSAGNRDCGDPSPSD